MRVKEIFLADGGRFGKISCWNPVAFIEAWCIKEKRDYTKSWNRVIPSNSEVFLPVRLYSAPSYVILTLPLCGTTSPPYVCEDSVGYLILNIETTFHLNHVVYLSYLEKTRVSYRPWDNGCFLWLLPPPPAALSLYCLWGSVPRPWLL